MEKKAINHVAGDESDKEIGDILINILLDRSGSMSGKEEDTIGHYNSFMKDQRELPGKATVSLVLFDEAYDEIYVGKDIKDVPKLDSSTYFVRGSTALLDALGKLVSAVDGLKDKPDKILFVINTDGHENASREYTREKIKALVTERRDNHGWEFLFVGAGLDAFAEARQYGFTNYSTFTASDTAAGSTNTYSYVNTVTSTLRKTGARGQSLYDSALATTDFVEDSAAPETGGQSAKKAKNKKVTTPK